MFSAMDAEHPVDLDSRRAHVRNLSLHSIGPERYVGIAGTFQHLILHSSYHDRYFHCCRWRLQPEFLPLFCSLPD